MLSRTADSLYWLNRYMERSDCMIRVIRTNYILSFDAGSHTDFSWPDVVSLFAPGKEKIISESKEPVAAALCLLISEVENHNSLKTLISRARENARGAQDNITKEVWEQVNQLYHIVNQAGLTELISSTASLDIIDELDQHSTLYYGVTDSTMPRGQGWNFMNLGKFLERCLMTIDTTAAHFKKIDHQVNVPQDILFWRNLLLSLSGYELYLKNYARGPHNTSVMDHIIFNRDFPRSLIYSLERVKRYLDEVAEDTKMEGSSSLQKHLGRICSKVEFIDMNMIKEQSLPEFLSGLRYELSEFSNQLNRIYFSYA